MKIGYLRIRSNYLTPFWTSSFKKMLSGHCQQDNVEELFSIFIGHCCPTVMKELKAKRFCKIIGHSCPIFLKRSFVLMPADLCTLNAINDSPGGSTLWTLINFISCRKKPAKNAVLYITTKFIVQNNFSFLMDVRCVAASRDRYWCTAMHPHLFSILN